jgi:phospholipase/lecithinase/hemolysin
VLAAAAPSALGADDRFSGQVTDSLRKPTHRLLADGGRASADLVFADGTHAGTTVHTCVRRRDVAGVRTCFNVVTGDAGVQSVTPLRFPRGRYVVRWSVHGEVVAHWRFVVVDHTG